jgi:hypothetical protein
MIGLKLNMMLNPKAVFGQDMGDTEVAEGFSNVLGVNFGGGKGGGTSTVEVPTFVPPPAAPAVLEAATQEMAVTPEEEAARKKQANRQGAKSLQIPTLSTAANTATVGTGTPSTPTGM